MTRFQLGLSALASVLALGGCARSSADVFGDARVPDRPEPDAGADAGPTDDRDPAPGEPDASTPVRDAGTPEREPDAGAPVIPEVDAGPAQPECVPGTYAGSFSGTISVLGFINIPITGTITIGALSSSNGDVLTIDNGKVTGTDQDGNPVEADVFGTLRCATKRLEDGELRNGVYVRRSLNQTVNFAGTAEATYVPGDVPRVMGSWRTQGGIEMGTGPFDAALTP